MYYGCVHAIERQRERLLVGSSLVELEAIGISSVSPPLNLRIYIHIFFSSRIRICEYVY